MSEKEIQDTSFECKLCSKSVSFHINDSNSYIALSEEKKFAGMTLGTYRVGHYHENELHINVVTVDHKGHWRAYVDAYIDTQPVKKEVLFRFGDPNIIALEPSKDIEFLVIVDTIEGWVFDIICPSRLLPVEIAMDIMKNFDAMDEEIIQEGILLNLEVTIGLETFSCNKLGQKLIISIINNVDEADKFNKFFEKLLSLNFSESKHFLNRDSFKIVFEIMEKPEYNQNKISSILRLIQDGPKSNPVNIHDFGTIPDLINKVINQKSYPEHLIIGMISLLSGQNTLNELLNQGYLKNYEDILDVIDFIRVKLLTDGYLDYPEESDRVDKPVLINGATRHEEKADQIKPKIKAEEFDTLFEDLPPLDLEEKKKKKSDIIIEPKSVEKPNFESFLDLETDNKKETETPQSPNEDTEFQSLQHSDSSIISSEDTPVMEKSDEPREPLREVSSLDSKEESSSETIVGISNDQRSKLAEIAERRKRQREMRDKEIE